MLSVVNDGTLSLLSSLILQMTFRCKLYRMAPYSMATQNLTIRYDSVVTFKADRFLYWDELVLGILCVPHPDMGPLV